MIEPDQGENEHPVVDDDGAITAEKESMSGETSSRFPWKTNAGNAERTRWSTIRKTFDRS